MEACGAREPACHAAGGPGACARPHIAVAEAHKAVLQFQPCGVVQGYVVQASLHAAAHRAADLCGQGDAPGVALRQVPGDVEVGELSLGIIQMQLAVGGIYVPGGHRLAVGRDGQRSGHVATREHHGQALVAQAADAGEGVVARLRSGKHVGFHQVAPSAEPGVVVHLVQGMLQGGVHPLAHGAGVGVLGGDVGPCVALGEEICGPCGIGIEDAVDALPPHQAVALQEQVPARGAEERDLLEVVKIVVGIQGFGLLVSAIAVEADLVGIAEAHAGEKRGSEAVDAVLGDVYLAPCARGQYGVVGIPPGGRAGCRRGRPGSAWERGGDDADAGRNQLAVALAQAYDGQEAVVQQSLSAPYAQVAVYVERVAYQVVILPGQGSLAGRELCPCGVFHADVVGVGPVVGLQRHHLGIHRAHGVTGYDLPVQEASSAPAPGRPCRPVYII